MRVYDLDGFLHNRRDETPEKVNEVVLDDATFKVVLDNLDAGIMPPLDALAGRATRELVVKGSHVYCERRLQDVLIFDKMKAEFTKQTGLNVQHDEHVDVEYEALGTLPEGIFCIDGFQAAFHVDGKGTITQLDFFKIGKNENDGEQAPKNKEFKNILVKQHAERDWADIAARFKA